MENIQQETEVNFKTPKQEALIAKLIQSSWFTKAERDFIVDRISGKLITTKDAGILIAYMIEKIRFQGHFSGKRSHKIAECVYCGNKVDLKRYEHISDGRRCWLCGYCNKAEDFEGYIEVKKNKAVEVEDC